MMKTFLTSLHRKPVIEFISFKACFFYLVIIRKGSLKNFDYNTSYNEKVRRVNCGTMIDCF